MTSNQATDLGDLAELLPDFQRHLRATNRAETTVERYTKEFRTFLTFLRCATLAAAQLVAPGDPAVDAPPRARRPR